MRHLDYQRTFIAYHGCDGALANRVLQTGETLKVSENDYDWLGSGIYLWEFGLDRAKAWAEELHRRFPKRVRKPAVLVAVIQLGSCFDLPSYSPELNPDERLNCALKSTLSHLPHAKGRAQPAKADLRLADLLPAAA